MPHTRRKTRRSIHGARRVPSVALLVETSTALGRGVFSGVARYMREHGRWSVFMRTGAESDFPMGLRRWRGDGAIVSIRRPEALAAVRRRAAAVVNVAHWTSVAGMPEVRVDEARVAETAVEYFRQRGFRRFGYIGLGDASFSRLRRDAFVAALGERSFDCSVCESVLPEDWLRHRARITAWLERLEKPAAILVCHDLQGRMLLEMCAGRGYRVPDEVAVLGVDNDPVICEMALPPLSSIDTAADRHGYEAAAMLDRMMRGERVESPPPLPPRGVVSRQSTDVMAVSDPVVAEAMWFIRQHFRSDISVEHVVSHVAVSRRNLERRFVHAVGRLPGAVLRAARLELARKMLIETDLPLAAVAARAGLGTAKSLCDVFGRATGETPGQHRRRLNRRDGGESAIVG